MTIIGRARIQTQTMWFKVHVLHLDAGDVAANRGWVELRWGSSVRVKESALDEMMQQLQK
jgi:hypothetical protein